MKRLLSPIFFFSALINNAVYTEVLQGVLEKYKKSNTFICMGVYSSTNLARALDAGFSELYAIDEDQILLDHARIIFPRDTNPHNYNALKNCTFKPGDFKTLKEVLYSIHVPATILLGSYFPDADTCQNNYIMHQLDIIQFHHVKTHVILIDYVNYAGTTRFDNISLDTLIAKLLEINPNYKLYFETGGILGKEQHAILVAYTIH